LEQRVFKRLMQLGLAGLTKHNYLVRDIKELPRVLKEAFYIAKSGRPGPVLVDVPKDITRRDWRV